MHDSLPLKFSGLRFWESIDEDHAKLLVSSVSFHYIMENLSLSVPKRVRQESKQQISDLREARLGLERDRAGDPIINVNSGACEVLFTMMDWDNVR